MTQINKFIKNANLCCLLVRLARPYIATRDWRVGFCWKMHSCHEWKNWVTLKFNVSNKYHHADRHSATRVALMLKLRIFVFLDRLGEKFSSFCWLAYISLRSTCGWILFIALQLTWIYRWMFGTPLIIHKSRSDLVGVWVHKYTCLCWFLFHKNLLISVASLVCLRIRY